MFIEKKYIELEKKQQHGTYTDKGRFQLALAVI